MIKKKLLFSVSFRLWMDWGQSFPPPGGSSCVFSDSGSGWRLFRRWCTGTVSLRCGSSCGPSGVPGESTPSHRSRTQTVWCPSGSWCGWSGKSCVWRNGRTRNSRTAPHQCALACEPWVRRWTRSLCCTRRRRAASRCCASSCESSGCSLTGRFCSRRGREKVAPWPCGSSRGTSGCRKVWNASRRFGSHTAALQSEWTCGGSKIEGHRQTFHRYCRRICLCWCVSCCELGAAPSNQRILGKCHICVVSLPHGPNGEYSDQTCKQRFCCKSYIWMACLLCAEKRGC